MIIGFALHWSPLLPIWMIALAAVVLAVLVMYGSSMLIGKNVPRSTVMLLGVLRALVIAIVVIALLRPVVSFQSDVEQLPELAVLVDVSKSMGATSGETTRLDAARKSLEKDGLTKVLEERFRPRWFAFDRTATPLDPTEFPGLKPSGETTNYAASLAAAINMVRTSDAEQGAPLVASRAILISDGNDLGVDDVVAEARRLSVAVDALAVADAGGTSTPSGSATIESVQAPPRVLLGAETQFSVNAVANGAFQGELIVNEDGQEVHKQPIAIPAGRGEERVAVSFKPTTAGLKKYDVQIKPSTKPEVSTEIEPYTVHVQVVDDKREVLVLEDRWRWEFKYLRRALEDDPTFNMTAMLARGNNAFVYLGEPDRRVNLASMPQSRTELDWFDVIILGDVKPQRWPRGLSGALADEVIEGGKSLVVIAGPNIDSLVEVPELRDLLPVEISPDTATPIAGPVGVRMSAEGAQSPFFFNPAPNQSTGATTELPELDQIYAPLKKRPGATVLVEAAAQANAFGPLIVIAEQTIGRGRVLYIGADTLWKWQTLSTPNEQDVTLYDTFWQQAMRAMATTRPSGANLWLQPERSRYEAGRRVRLKAELAAADESTGLEIRSHVVLPDGRRLPLEFIPEPATTSGYRAEFDASLPGEYRISATATAEGKTLADASTVLAVRPARGESETLPVDRTNLVRITSGTGGKLIDAADPATWPADDASSIRSIQQTHTVDLWSNLTLLVALCSVLGADWMIRLLRGLV